MTSILTNAGAMNALRSLRMTNTALEAASSQTATGLKVANAADNAALWSVSAVMRSDIASLRGVSDGLSLGGATVATARVAAETITGLLKDMKERIVLAQSDGVDRLKIDADVQALKAQVRGALDGAGFNGFNLLEDATPDTLSVPAAVTRGAPTPQIDIIEVERRFLRDTSASVPPVPGPPTPITGIRISGGGSVPGGNGAQTVGGSENFRFNGALLQAGDVVTVTINGATT